MVVHGTEYRMWADLAGRSNLPAAALPAVVEGLLPDGPKLEPWQSDVFKQALPKLLVRLENQPLRDELLAVADAGTVDSLARQGKLNSQDVAAVLARGGATPELVADLARDDTHRRVVTALLDRMSYGDLLSAGLASERPRLDGDHLQLPQADRWLLDALIRRGLSLVTAELAAFGAANRAAPRQAGRYWEPEGWPAYETLAMLVERVPQQWPDLVEDPEHGQAARHLLLDCMDTDKLGEDLLRACLPALCLPEWEDLPLPQRSQRRRLARIADRVARHPRLQELAAPGLQETVATIVKRGRLLHAAQRADRNPYKVPALAGDLAITSSDAGKLAQLVDLVVALPRPTAVHRLSSFDGSAPTPKEMLSSDTRVQALAALACNPHLNQDLITGVLDQLHPVEVQWLSAYDEVPAWLRQAAGAYANAHPDDDLPYVVSDDELDAVTDPEAVMQGWLDAIAQHQGAFFHQVEYAVLHSRHRTDALLRQLPANTVLSCHQEPVAVEALLRVCGDDADRWQAVLRDLTARPDSDETFGQFLDRHSARQPVTH